MDNSNMLLKENSRRRIMIIGDQHGNTENFFELFNYLEERFDPDVYISVGDLGIMGDYQKFLRKINALLQSKEKLLYFIDGNHDNHRKLRELLGDKETVSIASNVIYIKRGTIKNIYGLNFLFVGGAFSVDRNLRKLNKDYWEEEVISDDEYEDIIQKVMDFFDVEDEEEYLTRNIFAMITHDRPHIGVEDDREYDDTSFYEDVNDYKTHFQNRLKLQEIMLAATPSMCIHGHYHRRTSHTYELGISELSYPVQVEALGRDGYPLKEQCFMIEIGAK